MQRLLLALLLIAAFWTAPVTRACSCGEVSLSDEVRDAAAIFSGTVVKLEVVSVADGVSTIDATVVVEKRFRGHVPDTVVFRTHDGCCTCQPWFDIAKKYLVFAERSGTELTTSACSRTKELSLAKEELAFLEESRPD